MKKEIITSTDPKSPVSEVFRTLRTNLQYLNKKNGAQTILLTSTLQGEGKSFVAANLAVTFAQARKKTIIVDTDMRKPRQHKLFNSDMYPGLSNYLAGINISRGSHKINLKECIYKTKITNLYILPAGNIPPNPSELLQSEKLGQLVKILKNEYDVVIFDGAPCLLVTDASLVSRLVDATVLVISQGKTKADDLREVKNRIRRVGGRVAGVVLNRIKISGKRYGEKYYYYSSDSLKDKTRRKNEAEEDTDNKVERKRKSKLEYKGFTPKFDEMDNGEIKNNNSKNSKEDKFINEENKKREPNKRYKEYNRAEYKKNNSLEDNNRNVNNKYTESNSEQLNANDIASGSDKIKKILDDIEKMKEEK
ncbi:MAG: CpsD/CapB family tyrosine-protein kinase [Clostridia bacterium]|nr:CpsD/CapB family tyrosine-protein kinase [Clostridia bacterium]